MKQARSGSAKGNGAANGLPPGLQQAVVQQADPRVRVTPPNMQEATVMIRGTTPYVQHAFSAKAQAMMEETQRAGTQARSRKKRVARDFEEGFRNAQHIAEEGWNGIPATAIRNAMIDSCRLVDLVMTRAKMTVFIEPDGYDANDGTPLVRIYGDVEIHKGWGRNANGSADLRWRPMWKKGWWAIVRLRWDADQFSALDVINLLSRAGEQNGIGEGRPNSPNSYGIGWGLFEVAEAGEAAVAASTPRAAADEAASDSAVAARAAAIRAAPAANAAAANAAGGAPPPRKRGRPPGTARQRLPELVG